MLRMLKRNKFEVFFKYHHVMHYPWGKQKWLKDFASAPFQNKVIMVKKLCHVTHDQQAELIAREFENYYTFKPKRKQAKNPTNEAGRHSYVICKPTNKVPNEGTEYQCIRHTEDVLPGFYVWWSVDIDHEYKREWNSQDLQIDTIKYYLTDDFIEPSQSHYGNIMFSVDLIKLLQCYQKVFEEDDKKLPRVVFRCAGTLLYKYERAKVIIVCRQEDLSEYPLFNHHDFTLEYESDGTIRPNGSLSLTIENGVSGAAKKGMKS